MSKEKEIEEHVLKWIGIGLSTEKTNHEKVKETIKALYQDIFNLPVPRIAHFKSPVACSVGAARTAMEMMGEASPGEVLDEEKEKRLKLLTSEGYSNYYINQFWADFGAGIEWVNKNEKEAFANKDLEKKAEIFKVLIEECGWTWFHEELFCYSSKPVTIKRDANGKLHCTTGMAIEYADGFGISAIHGIVIPNEWLTRPATIDMIRNEGNIEKRRILIDLMGVKNFVKEGKFKVVDRGEPDHQVKGLRNARLLKDESGELILEMVNSTPEADGTNKLYHLRIDGTAYNGRAEKECLAAMASTWRENYNLDVLFFKSPEEYLDMMIET